MKDVFLILGYGVPEDIFKDGNYARYLKAALDNFLKKENDRRNGLIVFSGGMTDMFEPYERSESREMKRYFESLLKGTAVTQNWKILNEEASLSTLENLIFTKDLLEREEVLCETLTIFFEITREKRVRTLAKKVFPEANITFIAIDFDQTSNRYLDREFIQKKEAAALKQDIKAIEGPEYRKRYHELLEEKFSLLRHTELSKREEVLREWWKNEIRISNKEA